ncbi:MAG: DUF4432 family protein [Devosia sp.]|nr:DUF4432 family protein [Devosia sp.]
MATQVQFELTEEQFGPVERPLAMAGRIKVSAFRYATGIAALRVTNAVGEIVVLPYHGQQIWDATFHGRRLTMGSVFDAPEASEVYTRNYGAFLVHCGVMAIGNPAPEDSHPLHGEIPNARLQQARLSFEDGPEGPVVRIWGERRERVAFLANYSFTPEIALGEASSRLEVTVSVRNHRATPMDLMYLGHVNFRPVDGARIVDAVPDSPSHFRVRRHLPTYVRGAAEYRALLDGFAADPASHRSVVPGRLVAPELVAGLDCVAGPDGWSHALQVLPDGTADFISHRPEQLPRAVRWMTRNGDEDALGLVLPATAEADGKTAESRKGNVMSLAGGAEWRCKMRFGALDKDAAEQMAREIEAAGGEEGKTWSAGRPDGRLPWCEKGDQSGGGARFGLLTKSRAKRLRSSRIASGYGGWRAAPACRSPG